MQRLYGATPPPYAIGMLVLAGPCSTPSTTRRNWCLQNFNPSIQAWRNMPEPPSLTVRRSPGQSTTGRGASITAASRTTTRCKSCFPRLVGHGCTSCWPWMHISYLLPFGKLQGIPYAHVTSSRFTKEHERSLICGGPCMVFVKYVLQFTKL